MNGRQRIVMALQRQVPDIVPLFEWFIDQSVGIALTGSNDPLEIVERLDLDGINIRADYHYQMLDDVKLVDEWGITRQLTGDCLPALDKSPITEISRHADYQFPDPNSPTRFSTLERVLERFGDQRAIILNLRDGFSDMRDLLGYEGALMAVLADPQPFGELLERVVAYNLELATVAKQRYGTDIVATTDDVANAKGLLIRPETYLETIGPKFRDVIRGYQELGYLCIKHCDGNIDPLIDFWIECGIDCLDPIDPAGGYNMADMKERYGDRICLKGNVDCTGALCDGTGDEVEAEVRQCILDGAPGGGFILSSSNTIHRGVQPQNFHRMLDTRMKFGRYPDLGEAAV